MITQHVSQARRDFSDLLNRVVYQKERVILERHAKPIAAILPMRDFDRIRSILESGDEPLVPVGPFDRIVQTSAPAPDRFLDVL